ncbi:hypothetical protein LMG28727_04673 [Paraburkholderia kirstenboschensis]|nr:hypothetical protein LMG28727_04673 [Paraburkholderia kirstenboschensis]
MAVRNRVRFRSSETNMIDLMPAVLKSSSLAGVPSGCRMAADGGVHDSRLRPQAFVQAARVTQSRDNR